MPEHVRKRSADAVEAVGGGADDRHMGIAACFTSDVLAEAKRRFGAYDQSVSW